MRKLNVLFCLLLLLVVSTVFNANAQKSKSPVPIIFDSDMGPDYDDVGALAILHALADSGEAKILGTIASNRQPETAQFFDVINTYFGHPDMPIGVPKGIAVESPNNRGWGHVLVNEYPHDVGLSNQVPGSVELYRKILSNQPDSSVTIVTVGFMTNLAKLLLSEPDEYSELNGQELVSQKVSHLVSMAGKFPSGEEHNLVKDITSSDYVLEHWPTKIIFSGFKIGEKIKTGIPLIKNEEIKDSPVKTAYTVGITQYPQDRNGRSSWDQTAVVVAVRGAEPYYKLIPGRNSIDSDGVNTWDYSQTGHYYIVEDKSADYMQNLIDDLMQHQP